MNGSLLSSVISSSSSGQNQTMMCDLFESDSLEGALLPAFETESDLSLSPLSKTPKLEHTQAICMELDKESVKDHTERKIRFSNLPLTCMNEMVSERLGGKKISIQFIRKTKHGFCSFTKRTIKKTS